MRWGKVVPPKYGDQRPRCEMFLWRDGRRARCGRLAQFVGILWVRNGQLLGEHNLCRGHQDRIQAKGCRFTFATRRRRAA